MRCRALTLLTSSSNNNFNDDKDCDNDDDDVGDDSNIYRAYSDGSLY